MAEPRRKTRDERAQTPKPSRLEVSTGLDAAAGAPALDRLVHDRVRLGILSALAVSDGLGFTELRTVLETTDGNLSAHARKLEEAGYITVVKTFRERTPHTEFALTAAGRKALERYLDHMESLVRAVRATTD
ncbi:MAG TPA: transcriptional regulator [Longimicrobiales bacterium]